MECPYLGFQIEGRRPLVVERRKYEAVTRRINVTSERLEKRQDGSWVLVVEHTTDNVRGCYRFYDIVETDRYRFSGHHESLRREIRGWAERQRKSLAKPKLDARGRMIAKLENEIKNAWRGVGNAVIQEQIKATNRALIESLQAESIQ